MTDLALLAKKLAYVLGVVPDVVEPRLDDLLALVAALRPLARES